MRKLDPNIRERAEHLYVYENMPYLKICDEMKLSKHTVKRWLDTDKWEEKRQDFKKKASETLYHKMLSFIEVSAQRWLAQAAVMAQVCLEEAQNFKELGTEERKKNIKTMLYYSVLAERYSKVHKNVVPDANEQLSGRILEELKELNEKANRQNVFNESAAENKPNE